jgi:uncharacterized cupin superfamily protein
MTDKPTPKPILSAGEIAAAPARRIRHPLNPLSDVTVTPISMMAGLERVVLSIARVPPGKESFAYHSHERDEEFLYVLSGRGRAEIDGRFFEVGPGDFMGFTAPGPAHHLTNPYEEDLVYLMGGERSALEIGHFPKHKRKIIFSQSGILALSEDSLVPMDWKEWVEDAPT